MAGPARRGYFLSGLAGVLVGALLIGVLPALGAVGDPVYLGQDNYSGGWATSVKSGGTYSVKIINTKSSGVPLRLVAKPGQPPLSVNRAAWIQNLHADLLDGYQAHQLIRVAHDESTNVDEAVFGGGSSADILSTSITATSKGFLVLNASATVMGSGMTVPLDRFYCQIHVDGVEVTGTRRWGDLHAPGSGHTDQGDEICATGGVKPVNKGTHSVTFRLADRDTLVVDDASLSAIFVPFGAAGGLGTP